MRDIAIKSYNQSEVTDEALYKLAKESYRIWETHGLKASWMSKSLEEFCQYIPKQTMFVAVDDKTGELLGMHCFRPYSRQGYCYGFCLAVAPSALREGVATRMLAHETAFIRQKGYRYIRGVTATTADWSVRWHLKNGYRIVGYYHSPKDNFANYVFRKQLYFDLRHHPSDLLWMPLLAPLTARLRFAATYLATRLCKRSDGSVNALGRLAKKVLRK